MIGYFNAKSQVFKQPTKVTPNFMHQETDSKAAEGLPLTCVNLGPVPKILCRCNIQKNNRMSRSPCSRTSQNLVLLKQFFRRYLRVCFFNIEITVVSKGSAIDPEDLQPLCAISHHHWLGVSVLWKSVMIGFLKRARKRSQQAYGKRRENVNWPGGQQELLSILCARELFRTPLHMPDYCWVPQLLALVTTCHV